MTFHELISLVSRYLHKINDVDVTQMCGLTNVGGTGAAKTRNEIVYQIYNKQITFPVIPMLNVGQGFYYADGTWDADGNILASGIINQPTQPVSSFCYYLISADQNGHTTTTKGTDNAYALPDCPQGTTPIGAFKVATDSTHTFIGGETVFNSAGLTVNFYDIDTGIAASLINQALYAVEHPEIPFNYDYMKVRKSISLAKSATTFTFDIPRYKELGSANLIDVYGIRYPNLTKDDSLFNGMQFQYSMQPLPEGRPRRISRVPVAETTFDPDVAPTMQFILSPACDQAYTLDLQVYQYSPSLDGVIYRTNWLTQNAHEILLYGALLKAQPYLKDDNRIPVWQSEYNKAVAGLQGAQRIEKVAGSYMCVQVQGYVP